MKKPIAKRRIQFLVRRTPNHAVMASCSIIEEREIVFHSLKSVLGPVPDFSDLAGKVWPKTRTELRHEIIARLRAIHDKSAALSTPSGATAP